MEPSSMRPSHLHHNRLAILRGARRDGRCSPSGPGLRHDRAVTASWIYELSGDLVSIGLEPCGGGCDNGHCDTYATGYNLGAMGEIALC